MTFPGLTDREILKMLEFYIKHARQSIVHANEAIARLNTEAAEIETALRLQKMPLAKQTSGKGS